jgi:hypothetical protein
MQKKVYSKQKPNHHGGIQRLASIPAGKFEHELINISALNMASHYQTSAEIDAKPT